jgi:putative transposase
MLSEGKTIGEVRRQLEVVGATFHRGRNQYGGMKADDAKQFKELQVENGRLKKPAADLTLDQQILEAERDRGGSVKGGENGEPGAPQG